MEKFAIILAAGKGTRMKSLLDYKSKVSYEILGVPLVKHVLNALKPLELKKVVTIVGFGGEVTTEIVKDESEVVWQREQKGTGHAVMQTKPVLKDEKGATIILCGDTPLLTTETLNGLFEAHINNGNQLTLLGARIENPQGYGRLVINDKGELVKIVEQKDCTEEERKINVVNAGVYVFDNELLYKYLDLITPNNKAGEYYLTDLIEIFKNHGHKLGYSIMDGDEEMLGINDRNQLAYAAKLMKRNINKRLMLSGVTIIDPENTYIGPYVEIEPDTIINPNTTILGNTHIGQRNEIGPSSYIENAKIGNDNKIEFSKVINSEIGNENNVGPYSHIRNTTIIRNKCRVGNFVELKNVVLADGVAVAHHSYIGDATIDEYSNIGSGVITANYDGKVKHTTTIGKNVFVGSNSTLIAPVVLEDNSFIAAGSTITDNVEENALAIARNRQENKADYAEKIRNK